MYTDETSNGNGRVGRLPVFIDEDQWARAFEAARYELACLEGSGVLLPQTAETRTHIATRVATAALRAAAQDAESDITSMPGVTAENVVDRAYTPRRVTFPIDTRASDFVKMTGSASLPPIHEGGIGMVLSSGGYREMTDEDLPWLNDTGQTVSVTYDGESEVLEPGDTIYNRHLMSPQYWQDLMPD